MAVVNLKKHQIECKIVYYGLARCGKTTNLEYIHKTFSQHVKGKMISIDTEGDRTLFFDFLPLELGKVKGCDVRVQLYTVPGQVRYASTRKLVLRGADGVVFVADSQTERFEANLESLQDMLENLRDYKIEFATIPYVLQLNKRDLPNVTPANELISILRKKEEPVLEAVAYKGDGVVDTLKAISKLIMSEVKNKIG